MDSTEKLKIIEELKDAMMQENKNYDKLGQIIETLRNSGVKNSEIDKMINIAKKGINDSINKIILQDVSDGYTRKEIANKLGLTEQAINDRLQKMSKSGIKIPNPGECRSKRKYREIINESEGLDPRILAGLKEGKTQVEIAKKIGVVPSTVSQRIWRMNSNRVSTKPKDKINDIILAGLARGKSQKQIASYFGKSRQSIWQRIQKMKRQDEVLANMIVNLMKTKGATEEQVKIMAERYGVNIDEILNSLDEYEK